MLTRFPLSPDLLFSRMASDPDKNVSDLRRDYSRQTLDLENLNPDPFTQFRSWFDQARESGEVLEPNAMSLATVDPDGQPSLRTVLLKALDDKGFTFFTNYGSAKAKQMESNPHVALLFFWPALERQVKIQGVVEKVSRRESVAYFLSRPMGSRLGAWVSEQSQVVSTKALLVSKLDEMKRKFADGEVPCPDFWGGYRVVPSLFEFWQGGRDRLHDRFQYTPDEAAWKIERLAP